ncbi:hypothetical protein [Chitinimonas sp.]
MAEQEFGDTLVLRTTHITVSFSKRSRHLDMERDINRVFQDMVDDGTA